MEDTLIDAIQVYKCPNPKVRLGSQYDGGYVIIDELGKYDIVLSGGVETNNSFEVALVEKLGGDIKCHTFDPTVEVSPVHHPSITHHKLKIDSKTYEGATNLDEFMEGYDNIFLKLDIEEGEYPFFMFASEDKIRKFKQIVMEWHLTLPQPWIQQHQVFCIDKLAKTHTLVHFHANNWCPPPTLLHSKKGFIQVPKTFECTYVRNDLIKPLEPSTDPVPSAIDMRNIPHFPETVLSGYPYNSL